IKGKDTALTKLNSQIAELTSMLQLERSNSADLQNQVATLTATLATAQSDKDKLTSQLASLGNGQSDKDAQIAGLSSDLANQKKLSDQADAQVALLNQQLSALRTQISALESALDASEARDAQSKTAIADLGRRLNLALAQRVQDLSRYRSDFFGRLRQVLEGRADIQVVGDRFVFQSEVLFPAGQATISDDGKAELAQLATALKQIAAEIPPDINWVLRIDGHTDKRPISTPQFPSNWELSAARAIAVAKFLVTQGVDPTRLVPAGFGDNKPIDPGDTDAAYAKNRRIEFRLTDG
ncbi:MAG TPA: peptidoglycan -binding protein, partial [Devosia sp.]|nr:peptidoglycan -binding protein [Devosia sp.]